MASRSGGIISGRLVKAEDSKGGRILTLIFFTAVRTYSRSRLLGVLRNVGSYISDLTYKYWKSYEGAGVGDAADKSHGKDTVLWMNFDTLEEKRVLVVGYNNGFSIWSLQGDTSNTEEGTRLDRKRAEGKKATYGSLVEVVSRRKDAPIKQIVCLPSPDSQVRQKCQNVSPWLWSNCMQHASLPIHLLTDRINSKRSRRFSVASIQCWLY